VAKQERDRKTVRVVDLPNGLPSIGELHIELEEYWDVLLGRVESPIDEGVSNLAHLASAYYGRAKEMEASILAGERDHLFAKNGPHYRFRTGELRSFIEMAKNSYELGSRLITVDLAARDMRWDEPSA
jgi:hypothetical protein